MENKLDIFSYNLRLLRKKRNLTQEKAAQKLGCSRAAYSSYERGRKMPPGWLLFDIASFYGVRSDKITSEKIV